jgi:hypothetical protein
MRGATIRRSHILRRSLLVLLGAIAALTVVLAAAALAAHPKAGKKYSGFTSAAKVNGFRAPVSFKVSSSGGKLLSFKYGHAGCATMGPQPPGNPYLKSGALANVGTVHVSSTGAFSIKNVKTTTGSNPTFFTISSVTGKFKAAKTATGSITYSTGFTAPGITHTCVTSTVTFTATVK